MGKVIHWELCQKFRFDRANKWYIHNPESVLENETHKIVWDFKLRTDHLITDRRPDQVIVNKKKKKKKKKKERKKKNKEKRTCRIVDFAVPTDHRVKLKESKKRDKYLDLARQLKKTKTMKNEGDSDTNYPIYQPLRSGRIWHKVNFWSGV